MTKASDDQLVDLKSLQKQLRDVSKRLSNLERTREEVDRGAQLILGHQYREEARRGVPPPPFAEVGFQNYSQFDEDGVLHYIFSLIGAVSRRTVEMCAGTGFESNSANLILNHGWDALLVDGDEALVRQGVDFFSNHPRTAISGPKFLNRWVDCESVNDLLTEAGFAGEVDLLVVDMDGVDYWIWDAITVTSPRVVCTEVMPHLGDRSITVPYKRDFQPIGIRLEEKDNGSRNIDRNSADIMNIAFYGGASLPAYAKLANRKGYRLVGATQLGNNAFFMRNDVGQDYFPEVPWEGCINTTFDVKQREKILNALLKLEWEEV